jgi:hypothetical protein
MQPVVDRGLMAFLMPHAALALDAFTDAGLT